jgi:hypothetical protein
MIACNGLQALVIALMPTLWWLGALTFPLLAVLAESGALLVLQ